MAPTKIVLNASGGTQLIEIRHDMKRGLSVSRYRLWTHGDSGAREFTTLRKARAAFLAQVAETRSARPTSTGGV